ncbi:MAG TPA: PRC-barrel domain-containing protein [Geminicoccaceae bacterium]|nr:PRC-barrel domain-containing protein [Geminicoccaceae bacterium]
MTLKHASLCAAAVLALAPLAAAAQQSLDVSGYKEAEDDDLVVEPFNLSVDQIEDMDVKTAAGEEVGDVEEVLTDASGQPVAVSLEVGGFLGIGEREVVVGLDQLQLADDDFVIDADKAMVEGLPDWKD